MNASKCLQHASGYTAFHDKCMQLEIVYFISGWHYKSLTGIMSFDVISIPPTVIFNLLIICVVIKNRSLQTVSNLLLTSLAVSDFSTGMLTQPLIITSLSVILRCRSICWLFVSSFQTGYYLAMVSFLTLIAVSLDRYIAIFYPYKYQHLTASNSRALRIIIVTWMLPIITVAVSFATNNMRLQSLVLAILAPLAIILSAVAQVRTLAAVRRVYKREASLSIAGTADSKTARQRRNRLISNKATRVAAMILLTTVFCYLPYSVLTLIRSLRSDKFAFQGIYDWTKTLVVLNSTLNPIIYCLNLRDMRGKIFQMFCPHCCAARCRARRTVASFVVTDTKLRTISMTEFKGR